ncbi:hypothetical protein J3R82DRAFT_4367 [Butyriboletus roseoflavus]|nr:hypothetical protein J3R82DRAFT_4367 [Butyriboletus roseoflavus]
MSSTSTPNDSPISAPFQPMHNPSQAAHIVVPQAPLGNATNGTTVAPGMGMKALLAKKMAKSNNPKLCSPTDNMVTPATQKLNAARQKRFAKGAKPTGNLFTNKEQETLSSDELQSESDAEQSDSKAPVVPAHEDANPFEL